MLLRHFITYMVIIATSFSFVNAQSVAISKPNLTFDFLCQSQMVNTVHTINFTVSPISNLSASNVFSLEMSNDDFNANITSISIISVSQANTPSQFNLTFSLPNTTYGTNFKLRVKSSAPAATSLKSDAFDAYYMLHNEEIKLNTADGIGNASFCSGSNFTLFIYDSGNSSSPLFYPALTYTWYKVQGTTQTPIGTGSSLAINQVGQYFVEANYGVCTPSSNSKSRIVTVTEASPFSVSISSNPNTTSICEGTPVDLILNLANPSAYSIQWFHNEEPISGANTGTYTATTSGSYKASVDNGSCVTETTAYELSSESFNVTINLNSPYELTFGETVNVEVATDAQQAVYQWYFNGNLVNETSNILQLIQAGNYSVKISQTVGCETSVQIEFIIQEPSISEIPNIISPNGDGINDKFKLPNDLLNEGNIKLEIMNSAGKKILETENYQNNWPETNEEAVVNSAFFYFVISKNNTIIKQGILTVIR